jgi:hypothetical protein
MTQRAPTCRAARESTRVPKRQQVEQSERAIILGRRVDFWSDRLLAQKAPSSEPTLVPTSR